MTNKYDYSLEKCKELFIIKVRDILVMSMVIKLCVPI